MQKLTTFLTFAKHAEQAAKFYVSIFKPSKILKTTRYGEAGPGAKGSVMTVQFKLAGQEYIALNGGDPFTFSMPCGWVKDKFGMFWQVNPTILVKMLADKNAAKANRVMNAMMDMYKIDIAGLKAAYNG